jgi:hypothetical protein
MDSNVNSNSKVETSNNKDNSTTSSQSSNVSALEYNIKSKGENAYYYAHKRKFENKGEENGQIIEGHGLITGGDPVHLGKTTNIEHIKETKKFTKYIFYDDGAKAVIKIDLPDTIKDSITDDCIVINLLERGFDLRVNVPNGEPYFFSVKKLFKKIDPNESTAKIFKGKCVISLKKVDEDEEWDKLQA